MHEIIHGLLSRGKSLPWSYAIKSSLKKVLSNFAKTIDKRLSYEHCDIKICKPASRQSALAFQ